jgi:hypothetical protein
VSIQDIIIDTLMAFSYTYPIKKRILISSVPGISFAEHGPRDMGLSYSYLEERTFTKGEMPW